MNNPKIPSDAFLNSDKKAQLVAPPNGFCEEIELRLSEIRQHSPKLYPLFFRMYAGQTGASKAIKAKCLDCTNWQKSEITHCTVVTCPLHAFRPYQGKEDERDAEPECEL